MSTLTKDILQLKRDNSEKLNKLGVELEQFQKENNRKLDKIKSTLTQIQNEQEEQMNKLNEKLVEMKDGNVQKINLLTEEVSQMKKELIKLKRVNDQLLEKLAIKLKKTENNQISELNKRVKRLEEYFDETREQKHLSQAEFPGLNEESKSSCKKTSEHDTANEGCVVFSDMEDNDSGQQDFNSSELLKELLAPSPQESKGSCENEDEVESVASGKDSEQLGTRLSKSRTNTKPSKKQAKPIVIKKKRLSQTSIVKGEECEMDGQEDSDSKIDKSERLLDQQKSGSGQRKKRNHSVSHSSSDVEAKKKQKGEETDNSVLEDQQQDSGKRKSKGRKKNSTARQKKGKDEEQEEEEEDNLMEFLNDDSLSKKQKQKALLQSKNALKCFRIKSSIDKKISYEDLTSCINAAKKILETDGIKTLLQEACVYAGSWHRVDYIKVLCEAVKDEAYLYDVVETAFIEMLAFHGIKYTKAQCEGWGLSGHGLDKKKYIMWNSTSCLQFLWQLLDDDQRDKVKEAIEEPTSRTKFGKLEKVLSDKLQLCTECCNSDQIKFIRGVDLETDSDASSSSSTPIRRSNKKTDDPMETDKDVPQVKTEKVDIDSDDNSDKEETDAHVNNEGKADANGEKDDARGNSEKDDDAHGNSEKDDKDTDDSKSDEMVIIESV